jgi:protein-S-isoprenylcysteine O-methyltransferase Ste14
MRATKFEFEQRFWIIGVIFWIGFSLTAVDHTNVATALLHALSPSLDEESPRASVALRAIFTGGALLVFLAAWLRTWATAYLRTTVVHDRQQHAEALVADGPYRYTRNPLYLANLPFAAGVGMLASRIGWIVLVGGMWLFVYRLIFREEDGLLATQGESYRAYVRAVPRFWPSLSPRVPSGGGVPRWGQAIGGEIFVWLFGVGVLSFAVTLDIRWTLIVFAASFAAYFAAVAIIKRRAGPA